MPIAGLMTERITLQRHDTATDTWVNLPLMAEVWANVQAIGPARYTFLIRSRPDLLDFMDAVPALRVRYRGRELDVEDLTPDSPREGLLITAQGVLVPVRNISSTARQTHKIWPEP